MPKIILPQKNLSLDAAPGGNLMNTLLEAGLPVASSCHGEGVCSMCKMQIEGPVPAPEDFEVQALLRNKCEPGERLSCQITITADLVVRTRYW